MRYLFRHMLERLGQMLLAEGQLADRPDLRVRLQCLLQLRVKASRLERNDLGRRVRVVGDGTTTFRAEDAMDGLAGTALACPALGVPFDGELVLEHDGNEGVGRAGLALAVVTVVVANEGGSILSEVRLSDWSAGARLVGSHTMSTEKVTALQRQWPVRGMMAGTCRGLRKGSRFDDQLQKEWDEFSRSQ